jgi:hypothetical protein
MNSITQLFQKRAGMVATVPYVLTSKCVNNMGGFGGLYNRLGTVVIPLALIGGVSGGSYGIYESNKYCKSNLVEEYYKIKIANTKFAYESYKLKIATTTFACITGIATGILVGVLSPIIMPICGLFAVKKSLYNSNGMNENISDNNNIHYPA